MVMETICTCLVGRVRVCFCPFQFEEYGVVTGCVVFFTLQRGAPCSQGAQCWMPWSRAVPAVKQSSVMGRWDTVGVQTRLERPHWTP